MADSGYVREVYEASYRRLVAQAYAVAGDRVEAEDACRRRSHERWRPASGSGASTTPRPGCGRSPSTCCARRWRRAQMFRVLTPRIATPSDVPGISEDHVAVIEALRALPFQQRETVSLFYLGDLSVQEIAATLGVADGTVKSRLSRGRTALAELLQTTVEADRG